MPELLKSYVVRNAELLTPKQIDSIGIQSHPEALQSKRFVVWSGLCAERRYQEVEAQMRKFLDSEEAIRSTKQISAAIRNPIEFAEYNGFQFKSEEFLQHVDIQQLSREFGERDKDGRYGDDSNFKKVYSNLADKLIAKARISDITIKSTLDVQAVLKTLRLIERAYAGRTGSFDVNVEQIYASPIILPYCLINMDPCRDISYTDTTGPQDIKDKTIKNRCECKCNTDCIPQNPCCAKITPYVADLFIVRDEIRCYEVGEMSYIENVLESEIRVRKHRYLEKEEFLTEQTEERTFSEEKDHQVDEQFSLQTEISKTVEQELSVDAGVTVNYNWGTGSVAATTDTGYNLSKKDAQNTIQKYSREVIDKAITKLEIKTRHFASRKLLREMEETNKHTFGGTSGAPSDISRQFYYVMQIKKAQMFNYGRRMLLDFYLPEPSELYKDLIARQFKLNKPDELTITPKEISKENYELLVRTYGLKDVAPPPELTKSGSFSFSGGKGDPKQHVSHGQYLWLGSGSGEETDTVNVPGGYVIERMSTNFGGVLFNGHHGPPDNINSSLSIDIADADLFIDSSGNQRDTVNTNPHEGAHTIKVSHMNTTEYNLVVIVFFKLKDEELLKWQLGVYDKIVEAHQKQVEAYEEALAKFEKYKEEKYRQNPFILLQEIQAQLKQAAISYISCQFFDSMNAMKRRVEPCGFPQMDSPEAEREGRFVRFFEQAFEWKFMNFIFYPSFWAAKCTWEDKFKEEAENMLFQQFLKAGYARVSVSVRPGFEGHVNYFLKTKQIWGETGQPPIMGPDFVPIYQELREERDNFNADREGTLDVLNGANTITLKGTDQYWNPGDPLALPAPIPSGPDANKIDLDIDREIFIDAKRYRIVVIQNLTAPSSTLKANWTITLERPYEGVAANDLPWSTGALFVGAPWEFKIPTRLVWLREKGGCLPCYPIECEE